jgi:hypothetical protein
VKGWDGMGWDAVADGAYVVAKEVAMWFCRQFLSRIMKKEFGCENNQSSVSFLKYHRSAAGVSKNIHKISKILIQ